MMISSLPSSSPLAETDIKSNEETKENEIIRVRQKKND